MVSPPLTSSKTRVHLSVHFERDYGAGIGVLEETRFDEDPPSIDCRVSCKAWGHEWTRARLELEQIMTEQDCMMVALLHTLGRVSKGYKQAAKKSRVQPRKLKPRIPKTIDLYATGVPQRTRHGMPQTLSITSTSAELVNAVTYFRELGTSGIRRIVTDTETEREIRQKSKNIGHMTWITDENKRALVLRVLWRFRSIERHCRNVELALVDTSRSMACRANGFSDYKFQRICQKLKDRAKHAAEKAKGDSTIDTGKLLSHASDIRRRSLVDFSAGLKTHYEIALAEMQKLLLSE